MRRCKSPQGLTDDCPVFVGARHRPRPATIATKLPRAYDDVQKWRGGGRTRKGRVVVSLVRFAAQHCSTHRTAPAPAPARHGGVGVLLLLLLAPFCCAV